MDERCSAERLVAPLRPPQVSIGYSYVLGVFVTCEPNVTRLPCFSFFLFPRCAIGTSLVNCCPTVSLNVCRCCSNIHLYLMRREEICVRHSSPFFASQV
jgi:hypothetical protein